MPKPMIAVRGRPVLAHIVAGLASAGVREVLIVVGYHEEVVRDYFGTGSGHGVHVHYVTQVTQDDHGR